MPTCAFHEPVTLCQNSRILPSQMFIRKLYLDHDYREALEYLALREGYITRALPNLPRLPIYEGTPEGVAARYLLGYTQRSNRIHEKSQLLQLIALFDSVDTKFSVLDWSNLVDAGLVSSEAGLLQATYHLRHSGSRRFTDDELDAYCADYLDRLPFRRRATVDAARLMHLSKRTILRKLQRMQHALLADGNIRHEATHAEMSTAFDVVINNSLEVVSAAPGWNQTSVQMPRIDGILASYIHTRLDWLSEGLADAQRESCAIVSRLISPACSPLPEPRSTLSELNCLVRTCLTDEMISLPQPTSLRDALRIRAQKPMIRFREVLTEWVSALQNGDTHIEKTVRADLRLASRDLRFTDAWRTYKQSPFQVVFNLAGGLVGPFGTILTLLDAVVEYAVRKVERRSNWLLMVRTPEPGRCLTSPCGREHG